MELTNIAITIVIYCLFIDRGICANCGPASEDWKYWPEEQQCYFLTTTKSEQQKSAAGQCSDYGATLLSVYDDREWDILTSLFDEAPATVYWIGLSRDGNTGLQRSLQDRQKGWRWSDGSLYKWETWHDSSSITDSQPSGEQDCVVARKTSNNSWDWYDEACNKAHNYVCKKEASDSGAAEMDVTTTNSYEISTATMNNGEISIRAGHDNGTVWIAAVAITPFIMLIVGGLLAKFFNQMAKCREKAMLKSSASREVLNLSSSSKSLDSEKESYTFSQHSMFSNISMEQPHTRQETQSELDLAWPPPGSLTWEKNDIT